MVQDLGRLYIAYPSVQDWSSDGHGEAGKASEVVLSLSYDTLPITIKPRYRPLGADIGAWNIICHLVPVRAAGGGVDAFLWAFYFILVGSTVRGSHTR